MIRTIFTLILLLCPTLVHAAVETRGVWLRPAAFTPQQAPITLEKIRRAGFNTLFVRAPELTNAHGLNRGEGNLKDFATFVDMATARGLSVHGWIANKWRTADQADFTDAREQKAQTDWALDVLARFPKLDGIHFDYIRYTDWGVPDITKIHGITEVLKQTRIGIQQKHPGRFLTAAVFIARYSYLGQADARGQIRWEGHVPGWFRSWYAANPDNYYVREPATEHAAGRFKEHRPFWRYGPTFLHYQQDPPGWLEQGVIDAIMPMQYTFDAVTWQKEVDAWSAMTGPRFHRVHMGLGWLVEKGHDDWKRDAPAMAHHIRAGRAMGVKGFCLFTLGAPGVDDEPLIHALGAPDGPFAQPARSALSRQR